MIKPYVGKNGTQWQVYGRRDKKKVYVGTYDSEREAKNAERRFAVTQGRSRPVNCQPNWISRAP